MFNHTLFLSPYFYTHTRSPITQAYAEEETEAKQVNRLPGFPVKVHTKDGGG